VKKPDIVATLSARVDKLSLDLDAAEMDIAELKGDLLRMVRLLDVHFGPEFAQAAKDILEKYQGPVVPDGGHRG
jgi:hypothetical protein